MSPHLLLQRYRAVMDAYLTGLEQASTAGLQLHGIRSVASFFVSRVDTEVDARLDHAGSEHADSLRGQAAVANARLAYQAFTELSRRDRWQRARSAGRPAPASALGVYGSQEPGLSETRCT